MPCNQVPPIIVALAGNAFLFEVFDLSSVTTVVNGASGLDQSLVDKLHALQPNWRILTAYGTSLPWSLARDRTHADP
jgi:hypothetical protein